VSKRSVEVMSSWEELSELLTVTRLDTGPASLSHMILGTGDAYRKAASTQKTTASLYILENQVARWGGN